MLQARHERLVSLGLSPLPAIVTMALGVCTFQVHRRKPLRVRNLNGTTQAVCSCGSWLVHWENFSGKIAMDCSLSHCRRTATVGGRVQKASPTDKTWYIIPLCDECNQKRGRDLLIPDSIVLISADVEETCAKP